MAITEIERKFLVEDGAWRNASTKQVHILQGYFKRGGADYASVRVRIIDDKALLTIKGKIIGCSRREFEYPIPVEDALELLNLFCTGRTVEKNRYFIPAAEEGLVWEIDEYLGPLKGHFTAELEIPTENFEFNKPEWLGEEKTDDRRFSNASLAMSQHWPE